jgi:hypothetical protein
MGLTIHYSLKANLTKPDDVRGLVESMREFALDLPFEEVGELKEFKGEGTDYQDAPAEDRWLIIQAGAHLITGGSAHRVAPLHAIAFSTLPGEGCEQANFGFCKYPAVISSQKRRLVTKMDGWRWSSFCKTQYASDPECGGIENFLRCHLCVIKMLDFLKKSSLVTVEVSDEGGYWEGRDLEQLAKEVGEWNAAIAGIVSALRSSEETKGMTLEAPITLFPNFEHLEAKGLDKLRRRLGHCGD